MALERRDHIGGNMLAAHPGGEALERMGFATAGGSQDGQVGIFVFFLVKEVEDDQGVVVLVGAQQNARLVADLEGCKHIGAGGGIGEDISLSQPIEFRVQLCQRQGGKEGLFLHVGAIFEGDLLSGHHFYHFGHPVFQVLSGEGFDGDQNIEIKKFLPVVKLPLEIVTGFHNVPHLVVVGAGGGHLADLCFVDPQVPAHLYLHPVGRHFVKEEVHINGLPRIDKRREPCGPHQRFVAGGRDVQIGVVNTVDHHIPGVAEIQVVRAGVIGSTHLLQVAAGQA